MEQEASPVDHAWGSVHDLHDTEDELAVHRVVSLRDVYEDSGASNAMPGHNHREEGGEVDVVPNEPPREVG
jgi:hypothetical protein